VVSGDGTVLASVDRPTRDGPFEDLPSLGRTARRLEPGTSLAGGPALQVAASFSPDLGHFVGRVRASGGDVVLDLHRDGVILYGTAEDAEAKNAAALALLKRTRRDGIDIDYLDVRTPSSPVLNPAR
jgi:hypothetical protein